MNRLWTMSSRRSTCLATTFVCLVGVVLAARGLMDESRVSLEGDMPRYLMNGAFLHDLARDFPLHAPLEYAQRYFARYPALSLGHHPLLPAVAVVPFYSLFGISVFSARLAAICAIGVTLVFWFRLVRETYDTPTALFASLLLLSIPGLPGLFQVVLSEPFALCLIVFSVYAMHRYTLTERRAWGIAFAIGVVLSGYAKHLAVLAFPVYVYQFVSAFGIRRLMARSTLLVVAAILIGLLPIIPLTLKYSQFNLTLVTASTPRVERVTGSNLLYFTRGLLAGQLKLGWPVLALAVVSAIGSAIRRDRRSLLFIVWILGIYSGLVMLSVGNDRFYCYWLPPFSGLAAAVLHLGSTPTRKTACAAVLVGVISYQGWTSAREGTGSPASRLSGAGGYEEAAAYVTNNPRGDTILYSAAVDTGYFVFFVRKHDPKHEMIVLRADKIFTTSRMRKLDFEKRITRPDEIAPILQAFGVGYVVIEDRRYPDGPLSWLQQAVLTPDFELVHRAKITSNDRRVANGTLSIYSYRGMTPGDRNAVLSMNVPLMNDSIQVRLGDLIGGNDDHHDP